MSWSLDLEYLENCNCEILCPCITSPVLRASYERCLAPLMMHIVKGEKDGVTLDGLSWAWLVDSPQEMGSGNWRVGIYLDEAATPEQDAALEEIVMGRAGGIPGLIGTLTGEVLGVKRVPFDFRSGDNVWSVKVGDYVDIEVEGVILAGQTEPATITNTAHFVSSSLPVAKGLRGFIKDPDFGFDWDNTGRNGHFKRFTWQS